MLFKLYDRWAALGERHLDSKINRIVQVLTVLTLIGFAAVIVHAGLVLREPHARDTMQHLFAAVIPSLAMLAGVIAAAFVTAGIFATTMYRWERVSPVARTMKRIEDDPRFAV